MSSEDNFSKLAVPCAVAAVAGALVSYCVCKKSCPGAALARKQATKKAADQKGTESNVIYETDKSVEQYMEFHFTPSSELFKPYNAEMKVKDAFDFTIRVAKKFKTFAPAKHGRVLDLGCAVGMSSFELSKHFDEVVGVDLSAAFIRRAERMAKERRAQYEGPEQGLRGVKRDISLSSDMHPEKCRFEVGDAMSVDPALGTFDALLAANLVCRVPDPEKMLRGFANVVHKGGVLVLVSPYSWWEGATSSDKWIGGKPGCERSEVLVQRILESVGFQKLDEANEPFLIRDHHRRFQLGFSSCTVWRKIE